jgi:hypothetical protein
VVTDDSSSSAAQVGADADTRGGVRKPEVIGLSSRSPVPTNGAFVGTHPTNAPFVGMGRAAA